jgi:hypothetical protein
MSGKIFVFGSNLDGQHAGGAARYAHLHHAAAMGVGEGLTGTSYALPTVGHDFTPMPIEEVADHVRTFLDYAASHPDEMFQVTRVGCGIAGFSDEQIAHLFTMAPRNCLFDSAWETLLPGATFWGTF